MTTEGRIDRIDEKLDRLERNLLALRILLPWAVRGGRKTQRTTLGWLEDCESAEDPAECLKEFLQIMQDELRKKPWWHLW